MNLLGKVYEGGEGEDGHGHQDEEEAELLVSLLEGVEQGLETSEVSDQLVNSQDPHHFDQSDYLPSLQTGKNIQVKIKIRLFSDNILIHLVTPTFYKDCNFSPW